MPFILLDIHNKTNSGHIWNIPNNF